MLASSFAAASLLHSSRLCGCLVFRSSQQPSGIHVLGSVLEYLLAAALIHAPSLHSCIIFPPSSSHHCVLPCSQQVQRDKLLRGLRRPEPAEPKAKSTPKRGLVAGAELHGTTRCYEGDGGRSPPNPRPSQRPKEGQLLAQSCTERIPPHTSPRHF